MSTYFKPVAMKFLRSLKRNNDRDWFNARKDVYERELKAPMLALIGEINEAMLDFAPEHVRQPQKIAMRIYRDTRFSNDKRPYKTQYPAWWSRQGMEKTSGGGFYMHVNPQEVVVAAGVYMPEREQLLALRRWMSEHHVEYRKLEKKLLAAKGFGFLPIDAQALTRMPKGFAADDPADEYLRARNWGVRVSLPASLAESPALLREVVKRLKLAAPLVAMLNAPLLHGVERKSVERLY